MFHELDDSLASCTPDEVDMLMNDIERPHGPHMDNT